VEPSRDQSFTGKSSRSSRYPRSLPFSHEVSDEQLAIDVCRNLEADHLREIRRLDDIAFRVLRGANGDRVEAENALEDFIEILFEGGALSMWKYRIVLTKIREGL
jgi:hypothetical protein